jgi:hypothetical protein
MFLAGLPGSIVGFAERKAKGISGNMDRHSRPI